jgi:hypothetical protein
LGSETPHSAFLAIPVILFYKLKFVIFGNEKTADYPNLIWEKEGPINH